MVFVEYNDLVTLLDFKFRVTWIAFVQYIWYTIWYLFYVIFIHFLANLHSNNYMLKDTTVFELMIQAEKVFNQDMYFKKTVKYVGEPMTHLESIASSAVYSFRKLSSAVRVCIWA